MMRVLCNHGRDIGSSCVDLQCAAPLLGFVPVFVHFVVTLVYFTMETDEASANGIGGISRLTCFMFDDVPCVSLLVRHWCILTFVWRTRADVGVFSSGVTRVLLTL
jgi:hypothetical protein